MKDSNGRNQFESDKKKTQERRGKTGREK